MLEISGLPDDTGDAKENVEQKLLDKARKLNLQLNSCDIDRIHRLGPKSSGKNRRVIVKFTNSKARQRVFNTRKFFGKGLFVQDSLTPFRSQLSFEARALKRDHKLLSTWVAGGNIYGLMVLNGHERKVQIKDLDAIDAIRNGV